MPVFAFFFLILLWLSRVGKIRVSAITFILTLLLVCLLASYQLGVDVPQVLLMYSLIIVISGILLSTRFALVMTAVISLALITLSYLQINQLYAFNLLWRKDQFYNWADTAVWIGTLVVIVVVSWLSNREMEKALQRARKSEAALKRERDSLEEKVLIRTEELRQAQLEKISQMYRFVEFGRLASGLFHDLSTPLNLVSLNLEILLQESKHHQREELRAIQKYLDRAQFGTKKLESFIAAARKQLQNENDRKVVNVSQEIEQTLELLSYKAKQAGVSFVLKKPAPLNSFLDPTKLTQIITNLVSNSLDSFSQMKSARKKVITIELEKKGTQIVLSVSDNAQGIPLDIQSKIFEPFFSTKQTKNNLGLGLSITKELVEKHLQGNLTLKSKVGQGSTFLVTFPHISKYHHTLK